MKNILLTLIFCMPVLLSAQNKFPEFKFLPIKVIVPGDMTYLQSDSSNLVGDDFVYHLNGQMFDMNKGEGHIQTQAEGFNGNTNQKTPWKTLTELLFAYQTNDFAKVRSLFTIESREAMDKMLSTNSDIKSYMSMASTISGIEVYCAYDDNGKIMAQTEIPEYDGVMPFVFEKIGQKYYMAIVTDSAAVNWNIGMHCLHNPGPMVSPQPVTLPTVLTTTVDTIGNYTPKAELFSFFLSQPESYLTLFIDVDGFMKVIARVQDGSPNDKATLPGLLNFELDGMNLPEGNIKVYAVESNYPIDLISKDAANNAIDFLIEVKVILVGK